MAVNVVPSYFGLIFLAVFLILIVVILKRVGKKALIIFPIILVLIVVSLLSYRQAGRFVSYQPDLDVLHDGMQAQSAIWTEAIDNYLEADQYACMEDAAEFLAGHLAGHHQAAGLGDKMLVYGQTPVTIGALTAFSDKIREQLNLADVRVDLSPGTLPSEPNLIVCALDVPTRKNGGAHMFNGVPINHNSGILRLLIEGHANMGHSVTYFEKDWLKTLSALRSAGHTSVAVARSSSSCTDETEAQRQAMWQAASMVEDLLEQANEDYTVLDQEIKITPQDLQTHRLVVDQFSQSLRTSTARVWRHAVLLNLPPAVLQNLLQQKTRQIQRMHRTWAKDLLSLAGLALVVFILYIFLNAATKGYYAWSLRVIALVTIVGIVVVLFLV